VGEARASRGSASSSRPPRPEHVDRGRGRLHEGGTGTRRPAELEEGHPGRALLSLRIRPVSNTDPMSMLSTRTEKTSLVPAGGTLP
jgi:hypothetical protein